MEQKALLEFVPPSFLRRERQESSKGGLPTIRKFASLVNTSAFYQDLSRDVKSL